MKTLKFICLLFIGFTFILGCSGNSGKLKTQPESESKVTQQKLIDNWSNYNIRYRQAALVFAPKNDDRKVLLGGKHGWWWVTIEDHESWTEFVNTNMTSQGDFRLVWSGHDNTTGVIEIWGSDNHLYGFIIYQQDLTEWVNLEVVSENTMRLAWERSIYLERPPPRGKLDSFFFE